MEVGNISVSLLTYESPGIKAALPRAANSAVAAPIRRGTSTGGALLVPSKIVVPTYILFASPP